MTPAAELEGLVEALWSSAFVSYGEWKKDADALLAYGERLRKEVLDEAAKVVERLHKERQCGSCQVLAAEIRALASPSAGRE